jgi:hypothetical protein
VLERHNLINAVESPTRLIVDKLLNQRLLLSVDLGYSNHLAQILYIKVDKPFHNLEYIRRRNFMEKNMQEFTVKEIQLMHNVIVYFKPLSFSSPTCFGK